MKGTAVPKAGHFRSMFSLGPQNQHHEKCSYTIHKYQKSTFLQIVFGNASLNLLSQTDPQLSVFSSCHPLAKARFGEHQGQGFLCSGTTTVEFLPKRGLPGSDSPVFQEAGFKSFPLNWIGFCLHAAIPPLFKFLLYVVAFRCLLCCKHVLILKFIMIGLWLMLFNFVSHLGAVFQRWRINVLNKLHYLSMGLFIYLCKLSISHLSNNTLSTKTAHTDKIWYKYKIQQTMTEHCVVWHSPDLEAK